MKRTRISIVAVFILSIIGSAFAQTGKIDCESTRRAWAADTSLPARYKNCTCERSDALPVCAGDDSEQVTTQNTNVNRPARQFDLAAENRIRAEADRRADEQRFVAAKSKLLQMLKPFDYASVVGDDPYRANFATRLRQLNCSASWALKALRAAQGAGSTLNTKPDDALDQASAMLNMAFGGAGGEPLSGCAEVRIFVPENPTIVEADPQFKFYRRVVSDAGKLVKEVAEAKRTTVKIVSERNANKTETDNNLREIARLKRLPRNTTNRQEIQKIESANSDLARRAAELQRQADELAAASVDQRKRIDELERKFEAVTADGSRAGEFLD